jgi:peroxiredoxin family protein
MENDMEAKKLALIATKGTLDWAYPPFILASTAAALNYEVQIFFTFYGLQLLRKDLSELKVSPLGNPGMPMKMPFGPQWFRGISWNIPNAVQSLVPGYESLATGLMKQTIRNTGVATIPELRSLCQEADVKMIACQMTVELFDFKTSDFIDNIEYGGAATFFEFAGESDICLYI